MLISFCSLREADTESQHFSPRPNLKRSRLDSFVATENEEESPPKRQMVRPFAFTHIRAVATNPPPETPKLSKSDIAPSESVKTKPASEIICRGPSTVAELLEQERAARSQMRNAPSSAISPAKDRKDSMTSTTLNLGILSRSERADRTIVEGKRLHIRNVVTRASKRDVVRTQYSFWPACKHAIYNIGNMLTLYQADFFAGYFVGAITMCVRDTDKSKSCFADFSTHEQAKRAMEDLNRTPLLGRMVDIEIAQPFAFVDEKEKDKHPLPVKSATKPRNSR